MHLQHQCLLEMVAHSDLFLGAVYNYLQAQTRLNQPGLKFTWISQMLSTGLGWIFTG